MRISDWSSDVCSSDLTIRDRGGHFGFSTHARLRIERTELVEAAQHLLDQRHRRIPGVSVDAVADVVDAQPRTETRQHQAHCARCELPRTDPHLQLVRDDASHPRSEAHTSELQLMRISSAVLWLKKQKQNNRFS